MELTSFFTGNTSSSPDRWAIGFSYYAGQGNQNGAPAWVSSQDVTTGWHTLSICTNSANAKDGTSAGVVEGIWLDGVQRTFTYGRCAGDHACSNMELISNSDSSWPLDINDYTGGTPNTLIHGDPLVATIGSNGLPPEPPGGWNSP